MLSMFGNRIPNSNVLFYCGNSSVCQIINKQSSKHPFIMKIVRSLFLLLVKYNIHLKCQHIPGINNTLCDKISRFQITNDVLMNHDSQHEQSTNKHPRFPSSTQLRRDLLREIKNSLSKNTKKVYKKYWYAFVHFINDRYNFALNYVNSQHIAE